MMHPSLITVTGQNHHARSDPDTIPHNDRFFKAFAGTPVLMRDGVGDSHKERLVAHCAIIANRNLCFSAKLDSPVNIAMVADANRFLSKEQLHLM